MNKSPENIAQLIIAAVLTLAGIGLLYLGTLLAPQGEIHETILVAFGEVATFAGAIIGIDYRYKRKTTNDPSNIDPPEQERQSRQRNYHIPHRRKDLFLPDQRECRLHHSSWDIPPRPLMVKKKKKTAAHH